MPKTALITILCMAMNFAFAENSRCLLPPDFGEPKMKIKAFSMSQIYIPLWYKNTRFFFSATNHKCVEFPYWGHGGNANNFKTMEECQTKCANYPQIPPPEFSVEGNCTSLSCDTDPSDLLPNCKMGKIPKNSPATCCPPVICTEKKNHSDKMCVYNSGVNDQVVIQSGASLPVSYYPCFECKCNDRFKGIITTEGKVCMEINCGLSFDDFKQKLDAGCKPDYFYKNTNKYRKPSCCPTQWKCSITSDSDLNQADSNIQTDTTDEPPVIKYISSSAIRSIFPAANQTFTTDATLTKHITGATLTNNITDATITKNNITDATLTKNNITDATLTKNNITDATLTKNNITDAGVIHTTSVPTLILPLGTET